MSAAAPLAVFGSINLDLVTRAERLPRPGETLFGLDASLALGGKGANQAVAAARLGGAVTLLGRVGEDGFARILRERLLAEGLDGDWILATPGPSGIAVIQIDAAGENAITVISGANARVSAADALAAAAPLARARWLMLQNEVPWAANREAAQQIRAAGGRVLLDPAPAVGLSLSTEDWALIDCVTPNETEAELLLGVRPEGEAGGLAAARALLDRGAGAAVVKMGAAGAVFATAGGESGMVPGFRVTAIDTVAAGDSFNAGLAVALAEGKGWAEAVRFACAAGALATTRRGAAEAAPYRSEAESLAAGAGGP